MGEAYEQINEGIFDRMKANSAGRQAVRDAGGKTGIGGMIQRGKHGIIKGLGGQLKSGEQKQMNAQSMARSQAQVNNITATYMTQIKKIAENMATDLKKLNVDPSLIEDDAAREIVKLIFDYQPPQSEPAPIKPQGAPGTLSGTLEG